MFRTSDTARPSNKCLIVHALVEIPEVSGHVPAISGERSLPVLVIGL